MNTACVQIKYGVGGSGFFAAPQYIVTCLHVLQKKNNENHPRGEALIGQEITYAYDKIGFKAKVVAVSTAEDDLALLSTEGYDKPSEYAYCVLDRVAVAGRQATVYGHPNDVQEQINTSVKIGNEIGSGEIALDDANNITNGYSGGPVCPICPEDSNRNKDNNRITSVGVLVGFDNKNTRRQNDSAYFIPAKKVLELWGDKVCERRYEVAPRTRYHNDFVYEAFKTDFIDPYGYKDKLTAFANDDEPVLWWAVIGAGGAGKSRLAYEFAHSLDSSWHCELVRADGLTKENLNTIYDKAARNTLILADYAYTDTNELGAWLTDAANDPTRYRHQVRVLLLQREDKDDKTGAGATVPW